jgi:hypothetical protein
MSKPKAPAAPDPVATANAQSEANRDTAGFNNTVNNPNQVTPYGSVTWSGGDPNYANQRPTQTVTESENQRALRDAQERAGISLGNLGADQADRVGGILGENYTTRRFDPNAATGGRLDIANALGGNFDNTRYDPTTALGDFGGAVENDTFNLATQGMDRAFGRSEESLRSQLANKGITEDSDAFRSEMEAFNTGKGNAFADARLNARGAALAQRGQQAGELSQGADLATGQRGIQLAELLQQRGTNLGEAESQYARDVQGDLNDRQIPLQEISSIMNGTPLNPINPGANYTNTAAAGDIQGNAWNAYNARQNTYNQQMGSRNALIGGLAGLGGAYLGRG